MEPQQQQNPAPAQPEQATPPAMEQPQQQPQPVASTPQPQATPMPEQPVKKKKTLKIVLIVLGIFFAIAIAGGVFAVVSTVQTVKEADGFVAALVSKDFDTAYEYFSPELKEVQTVEEFEEIFSPAEFSSSCVLDVSSRSTKTDTSTGTTNEITGDIVCGDDSYPTTLTFVKTDDGQKLLAYDIQPPAN